MATIFLICLKVYWNLKVIPIGDSTFFNHGSNDSSLASTSRLEKGYILLKALSGKGIKNSTE